MLCRILSGWYEVGDLQGKLVGGDNRPPGSVIREPPGPSFRSSKHLFELGNGVSQGSRSGSRPSSPPPTEDSLVTSGDAYRVAG